MDNDIIFQAFHWYLNPEENLWRRLLAEKDNLVQLGITVIWLPPAYKSAWGMAEPGYAVYDLYDLGEFDQKGTIRTRWGTKEEYISVLQAFREQGTKVLADIVLNHKIGGDEKEIVPVIKVNENNRSEMAGEQTTTEAFTKFSFPGRNKKYSSFEWNFMCFTGLCDNNAIYLICNEYAKNGWDSVPDSEYGNYDYLMGNDIEFRNPAVREELQHWGRWYTAETGIDGFRLDALKHMSATFARSWIDEMRKHFSKDFYTIGEYWKNDLNELQRYLHETDHALRLFDVPLHFNFHEASQKRSEYDLRQIFDNTLVKAKPDFAITFVENHDTQPLQSLQSPVEEWFKPAAYAMILLRQQGTPCVFYADLLGAQYRATTNEGKEAFVELKKVNGLEAMMQLRRAGINGSQHDYFERSDLIGWCVYDDEQKKESAFAVVIGNRDDTELKMSFGGLYAKQHFREVCGSFTNSIALDENGEANFPVKAGSVSIWVLTIV